MATLAEIQKQLDDKTFDPGKLTPQQRRAIDSAI